MERTSLIHLALVFAYLFSCVNASGSSTTQANVTVSCPFYLTLNTLSTYPRSGDIVMGYTVFTQAQCAISNLHGNFILKYKGNGTVISTNTLTVNSVTQTSATYGLPTINSLALQPNDYVATIGLSILSSSNSSSKNFTLLRPANVTVTDFSVNPSTVGQNSQITFFTSLLNDGQLSSSQIGMNIVITGPQNFNIVESANALSPGQTEQLALTVSTVTGTVGSYTASTYATYVSNNVLETSNTKTTSYTVTSSGGGGGGGTGTGGGAVNAIVSIPQIAFTQLPFFSSVLVGSTVVSQMGIKNTVTVPEVVKFQIPTAFENLLSLSATSVSLLPGQSVIVQVVFHAQGIGPGMYVIPVNLTVTTADGSSITKTQYLTYSVVNKTNNVTMLTQISSSLGNATVSLELTGSSSSSITNATLLTMLPPLIVTNASQIKTFGLPSSVSIVNGVPRINWVVPYLQAGKTITMTYSVSNPYSIGLLTLAQNLLVMPSKPSPGSILRLLNVQVPTFYTNSNNQITVDVLYTGTSQQNITFSLFSQSRIAITDSVQQANATPNQVLERKFNVLTNNATGTFLLALSIVTNGAGINYTIPVLVLQNPISQTTTIPQVLVSGAHLLQYGLPFLGAVAVLVVVITAARARRRSRYVPDRAKELIRIREQIKGNDEGSEKHG